MRRNIVSHPSKTPPPILKPLRNLVHYDSGQNPPGSFDIPNRVALPSLSNVIPPVHRNIPMLMEETPQKPKKRKEYTKSTVPPAKKVKKASAKKEKGLRHFSLLVCDMVQEKGKTTYEEVANELVIQCLNQNGSPQEKKNEENNIRRRVYDALNVLMAINMIEKGKKDITWKGLDQGIVELTGPFAQRKIMQDLIVEKKIQLQELVSHQTMLTRLIERNEKEFHLEMDEKIELPFILVNTDREADVDIEINQQETRLFLNFNTAFEIHDDHGVVKNILQ